MDREHAPVEPPGRVASVRELIATRHHRFGWWLLFVFATLGLVLESLAGMRVAWYVDASNETRHTMLRLAHAHGSLLAIVNVVFALSLESRASEGMRRPAMPSACLLAATVLIPVGFGLGGLWFYDGDPGLGIVLVPFGALGLLIGVALVARGTTRLPSA